ncbi:hypothetical protein S7711_09962 [Stachybotrys chartarum IBT 7711]|uniref:NmrA-like domain-containing protein n=1 Tax=Stachybotrys chartarum (strain CBS 109288 / IBT 7711) TaxID=1280523 RepID=A0A084BBF7_STACB|nr:hypothetical protein S7711_09962 [Stachybotrys chartarum IBT 7711]KFA50144.1 hypothetical protein S40293_10043 [Stachybotrys chartarum IBT 40293]
MLVLLAGATGSLGKQLIASFLKRNHQVRVIARNRSKLNEATLSQLEGFVQSKSYYDIEALDRACSGVDAVVCVYNGAPELQVDGQLLLVRAAERAGVRRYVASTWGGDFCELQLGDIDSYDGHLSFLKQVEKTSGIRPNYIFTGVLGEVMLTAKDTMDYSTKNHGPWDPDGKRMEIWGTGDEPWQWTCERDAAEFTAEIILRDGAEDGGHWRVCSGSHSLRQIAAVYEKMRGVPVALEFLGSVDELSSRAYEARRQGSPRNMWTYLGWFYYLFIVNGTFFMEELDNDRFDVKTTSLEEFIEENPQI